MDSSCWASIHIAHVWRSLSDLGVPFRLQIFPQDSASFKLSAHVLSQSQTAVVFKLCALKSLHTLKLQHHAQNGMSWDERLLFQCAIPSSFLMCILIYVSLRPAEKQRRRKEVPKGPSEHHQMFSPCLNKPRSRSLKR